MTTMDRVIRKTNKKAVRQLAKRNRKAEVETHNLTFVHQQLVESQRTPPVLTDGNGNLTWNSPFRKQRPTALTLSELFFLNGDTSTEPQQG